MSRQSEKGIIGCLLIDHNCITDISTTIHEGMFTDELYREIYIQFLKGYEKGENTDEVTIQWALEDKYPEIKDELIECVNSVATSVEIKSHASVVLGDYKAREADKIINHMQFKGTTADEDIKRVINDLNMLVENREVSAKSLASMTSFKDGYFCDKGDDGVTLGIKGIDDLIGTLEGGDITVIGARPSVGKSALIVQVAVHMVKHGKKIRLYNMEMKEKQIYERFISYISGIGLTRLRKAVAYTNNEKELFDKANETLRKDYKNLEVVTGSRTMSEIRAECLHKDLDVIIIDYLQLITPEGSYKGNRFAEVGEISRKLKNLAMEMNIPIIALSQLNRISEAKETKEPSMSELRESGNVEQDASVIILMWNLNEERTEKGVKVDKSRQGQVGKIELKFDGSKMKFIESNDWQDDTDYPFN